MNYTVTEKDGIYTATIPIPLSNGQELLVQGRASVDEVAEEMGLCIGCGGVNGCIGCEYPEVGAWYDDVYKFASDTVKTVKKAAKSKAVRKAVKIVKDVVKHPATNIALGVVTGGASVPAMTAAQTAIHIAEAALKPGPKGQKARKLLKKGIKSHRKREARDVRERRQMARTGKMPTRRRRPVVRLSPAQTRQKLQTLKRLLEGKRVPVRKKKALLQAFRAHLEGRRVPTSISEEAARFLVQLH